MEALDRRKWPGRRYRNARRAGLAVRRPAIVRRLIADGRETEVQEICDFISTIVPDPNACTVYPHRHMCDNRVTTTSFSIYVPPNSPAIHLLP